MIIKNYNHINRQTAVVSGIIDAGHHANGVHSIYIQYTEIDTNENLGESTYQSLAVGGEDFTETMNILELDLSSQDLDLNPIIGKIAEFEIDYSSAAYPIFREMEFIEECDLTEEELDPIILEMDDPDIAIEDYDDLPEFIIRRVKASTEFKEGFLS